MRRIVLITTCLWLVLATWVSGQSVFINELHYDDLTPGADINEGVEIAGPAGTNLSCYKLVFYNGVNGNPYATLNLSGTLTNQCNGFGTAWFALAPIQNGSPDGIALVFDPALSGCTAPGTLSVIQFLSYEGSFTAATGDAAPLTSVDIGVTESNSTPATTSLQLTGNGIQYSDFSWAASATSTHDALNNGQTFNGTCGVILPTELRFQHPPTGCYLPGDAFSIEVCATDGFGNIDSTYAGSVTVSKASGPGTLAGTTTLAFLNGCASFSSLTFDAAGPYTLNASDGSLSGTSATLYISPVCNTCPWMTGAHIDACGGNEGNNEILFFDSGDFCLGINSTDINVNYGLTNPPATNYTNGFVSNQPYVDSLNSLSACTPPLFVDAHSLGHIPPNSTFLMFRSDPINVYDYSNLCGTGPVYCVFSNDPDWNTTGNFKNCTDCSTTGATTRYFRCNFSALHGNNGCDFTNSYVPCADLVCSGNGDGLSFSYGGGPFSSAWNACVPSSPLPVLYASPLAGTYVGTDIRLDWRTAQETNSGHFVVERAEGISGTFTEIGRVAAMGNSSRLQAYHWLDSRPPYGALQYRLQQVDLDGNVSFSRIVSMSPDASYSAVAVRHLRQQEQLQVDLLGHGDTRLRLYSIDGRVLLDQALGRVEGNRRIALPLTHVSAMVLLYEVQLGARTFRGKVAW